MNKNIKKIDGGVCAVSDVKAGGIREGKYGLSIISFPKSMAVGVFTTNKIIAAPVKHTKNIVENNDLKAIVANSGNANCFTGSKGEEDCKNIVKSVSNKLKIDKNEIAIASTGVIGRKMPMKIMNKLIENIKLENSNKASNNSAKAIMTTDTVPKECSIEITLNNGAKVKIGGICKGIGMIAPNMATMLCFITTDAKIEDKKLLNQSLKDAVDKSFNMVVVDGDESTNDEVILVSTGKVDVLDDEVLDPNFQEGLNHLCTRLAKMIAKDGEGATKFLEVTVDGAKTYEDAKITAKSVISSPLVKTAIFGGDPNWGRIVAAIGYSGVDFNPDNISIAISNKKKKVDLVKNSEILGFEGTDNLKQAEKLMQSKNIKILVDLHIGDENATGFGCDLTYDYVKINSEYTT
ncbi:MAG: bifunctional ornithine acetyltransferase/N-acetylglutamate synthase [Methanobrevibacter sp.]|jgi:glutamate N-acetyltransferase/amino-acid N-acetyltransferase|nr:bifunctional ornithine acetyltransferase/N-acetylglutamate synthase [Candidatus Methanovirga aequatorialis]